MRVSYEKLIIREERAQIGQVALMKLASLLFKSQNLKTYTRLFEEGCTCNLSLKRRWSNKSKDYPFELENTAKTGFFSMESIFERDFLKIYTASRKPTHGKWKMDLFSNRIRFRFENRLTRTTIPFTLKSASWSWVWKWRVVGKRAIRDLKHRRRGRQRERQKTIVLISKTLALHVHCTLWYISLPSSAKQQGP